MLSNMTEITNFKEISRPGLLQQRLKSNARQISEVTGLDVGSKVRQARELLRRIAYLAKEVSPITVASMSSQD